jgi:hypothetical protein
LLTSDIQFLDKSMARHYSENQSVCIIVNNNCVRSSPHPD